MASSRDGWNTRASSRHAWSFVAASLQHAIVAVLVAKAAPTIPAPAPKPTRVVLSLEHFGTGPGGPSGSGPLRGSAAPASRVEAAVLAPPAPAPLPSAVPAPQAPAQTTESAEPKPSALRKKPEPRPAPPREAAARRGPSKPAADHDAGAAGAGTLSATPSGANDGSSSTGANGSGNGNGNGGSQGAEGSSSYRARILAWLERHKRYPARARAMGLEGRIVLRIELDRSGKVQSHSLESDGRYAVFTQEAESMLERAGSFPAVPPTIPGSTIEIVVPIDFRLEEGRRPS